MSKSTENYFHQQTPHSPPAKRKAVPMNFRVPDEIYTIFMQAVDRSGWDKIDVFNRMVALAGPILGADAAKANEFLYHSLMRHRSLMEIHKPTGKYKKGNGHD